MSLTRYTLGGNSAAPGGTTVTFTLAHAVASGDALLVAITSDSGGDTFTSVTDSHSQTWTQVTTDTGQSDIIAVYRCLNSAAMTTSDTITGTFGGTTGSHAIVGVGCSGIATSSAVDISITNDSAGSSSPSSGTSATLAQASEYAAAFVVNGNGGGTPGTWTGGFTGQLTEHTTNHEWLTVADKVVTTTAALTAGTTIASSKWAMVLVTLKAASGGSLTISTSSPLTAGQAAVPYTNTLAATGGVPPYTWDFSSGSYAALGLTLSSGSGSGNGDITYIGTNTGPQGAPTLAQWNTATYGNSGGTGTFGNGLLGAPSCYKVFFSSFPATWSGTLMDQITQEQPGVFCYFAWNDTPSQATITNFVATIPANIPAVGFCWNQEPENTAGSGLTPQTFQSGWATNMSRVKNAQSASKGAVLYTITTALVGFYQGTVTPNYQTTDPATGKPYGSTFIPPATYTDVYGIDLYDRKSFWGSSANLGGITAWTVWTGYVQNLGRPLAITEYGISDSSGTMTDNLMNARIQADWSYLQGAFGTGGTLSTQPLFCWLYWDTGSTSAPGPGTYVNSPSPPYNKNEFLGTSSEATWKAITATAGGVPTTTGSSGAGGVISGATPIAGTQAPTVRVTDSTGATATKTLSLTINSSSSLTVTSTSLPGGTTSVPYSTVLTASGGVPPYTWSKFSGSFPAGLSISGQQITGTPTGTGTSSLVIEVTDAASTTATASVSINIASTLAVSTTNLPSGTAGTAYSTVLAAANGVPPYTWGGLSGTLPNGLSLDPDGSVTGTAGQISGTPTTQGSYPVSFGVSDSAGATATSAVMTLAISPSGGGLGSPGRRVFGGAAGAQAITYSGNTVQRAPGITFTYWTTFAGSTGSQYTDLEDMSNNPITSVTADSNGFPPQFQGPSGVLSMYEDANAGAGPRRLVICDDIGALLLAVVSAVQGLAGT